MEEKSLQPDVAAKYDVDKVSIGKHHFKGFGVIDLSTLTLAQADSLTANGFYWLKLKTTAAPKLDVKIPPPAAK